MSKYCPESKLYVTYLDCMDCEEKTCINHKTYKTGTNVVIKMNKNNGKVVHTGDIIVAKTLFTELKYLYCGKYGKYRLLYGGKSQNGKLICCRYILREDDFF